MLWLVKRLFFGPVSEACQQLKDATRSEVWVLSILALFVVGFGFFPNLLTTQYADTTRVVAASFSRAEQQLKQFTQPQQVQQQAAVAVADSANVATASPQP
jgi:NADH:ubiquinone oxidoreductase subunit 4 (subunit M)